MGNKINKCVIIAGAPEENIEYYTDYLKDRFIICADSGYLKCNRLGIIPDLIIGDFDSSVKPDINCEIITLKVKKDDTDTLHCANEAITRGFNDIIILGGIGDRVDHTYSNILTLYHCSKPGIKCMIIDSKNRVRIINKEVELKKDNYKFFSIFPLFDTCKNVSIQGAEYNIINTDIHPYDTYTQSNSFISDVKITLESGNLLIIECND